MFPQRNRGTGDRARNQTELGYLLAEREDATRPARREA